jgi:hypothetical protein
MSYYKYRPMADLQMEEEINENMPWFEVVLVDPAANVIMPAEDGLRSLTELEARIKVEELNARLTGASNR